MSTPRIFISPPLASGRRVLLEGAAAQHVRVLRLRPGDSLAVFDGTGGEYAAELLHVDRRRVEVLLHCHRSVEAESPLKLTLVQAVSKGERMDWTVQKAVELGISRLLPVFTRRSIVRLEGQRLEKRMTHWRGVMRSACEQCGRNCVPELLSAVPLTAAWAQLDDGGLRLVLDPRGGRRLRQLADGSAGVASLLVGPEGGLTDEELEAAAGHGFKSLLLGPRVLRTETAGIAALAALQALCGDLG